MIKIAVDGYWAAKNRTGMGTVVIQTLFHVLPDDNVSITFYIPDDLSIEEREKLEKKGIIIKKLKKTNFILWEQFIIPRAVKKDKIDVLWAPYNTAGLNIHCNTVVMIHDVIFLHTRIKDTPGLYKKAGMVYRRFIAPRAASRAKKLITVSKYSQSEIVDSFKIEKSKIQVVYPAANKAQKGSSDEKWLEFTAENKINKPYFLGFASRERRKNSMNVLKAYELLDETIKNKYMLIFWGYKNWETSDEWQYIRKKNYKNIVMLGYISEEEKTSLYCNAEAFVFPSLYEGFGIPVLEAMQAEVPLITSNTTSIPEVAGDAAIFVDPKSESSIAKAMSRIVNYSPDERSALINKERERLKYFDWGKTSKEILSILTDCAKEI